MEVYPRIYIGVTTRYNYPATRAEKKHPDRSIALRNYLKGAPPPFWMPKSLQAEIIETGYPFDLTGSCSDICMMYKLKTYAVFYKIAMKELLSSPIIRMVTK